MKLEQFMPPDREELLPTRWTLIRNLKNWDNQESWREFFDTYWKLIHGTAIKSGLTDVEAQEVVQETVIAVCRTIKDLVATPEAGSFKAWLLKLVRWRIVDQVRKRRHAGVQRFRDPDTSRTPTTDKIPDPAGLELEKVWEEEWRMNLTNAALERLQRQVSGKHYQIFYLYVIRGSPVSQVAQATGVTADEVYLVKHRLSPLFKKAIQAVEEHRL